ncbi:hypothetical protein OUZ56_012294 [Daphnia magna]|uniref:Uncharacterized protein n=1 Tax=Daphnia magna TaxID=35525 RepID=A0ABQ9Z2M4_9CRUS|nr:hypothetical protein OUZ56_012294 [Daphnia magna]
MSGAGLAKSGVGTSISRSSVFSTGFALSGGVGAPSEDSKIRIVLPGVLGRGITLMVSAVCLQMVFQLEDQFDLDWTGPEWTGLGYRECGCASTGCGMSREGSVYFVQEGARLAY